MSQWTMNVSRPAPATASIAADATRGSTHKRDKLIYWSTTLLVCAVMTFSVFTFVFYDHFPFPNGREGAFVHLRLPNYFKIELTTAKALGILALLIPSIPHKIKEFAYFGFGITLVSAIIAHFAVGDVARLSILYLLDPLFFLAALIVSYSYFNRLSAPHRES